jgi:DNA-binding NarL/FixJ family response regulator
MVSESEAYECRRPLADGRLVLLLDEQVLAPQREPFLRSLRVRFPEAKVLILGTDPPCAEGCQALLGIDGFVPYAEARVKLIPALRALCDGHLWLPREVLDHFARLAAQARPPGNKDTGSLTSRESEIIRLLTEGLSNKEIGNSLSITERTVKFHVANVFAKLGVHDPNSAAEVAHSLYPLNNNRRRGVESPAGSRVTATVGQQGNSPLGESA